MEKKVFVLLSVLLAVIFLQSCGGDQSGEASSDPVRITIAASMVGDEMLLMQGHLDAFNAANPDIIAEIYPVDNVPQLRLQEYQQLFLSESPALDVVPIDVIWPGDLADYLVDLNQYFSQEELSDFFDGSLLNNTVGEALVGIPWFLDAGLFYYRRDLLEKHGRTVPNTWDELEETARYIQERERAEGNGDFWGFVWQGGPGEGLTCVALEFLVSNGAGRIVDTDGTVTVNNPRAREILDRARSWVGDISPVDVLGFAGAEGPRTYWQTGSFLFMRNWPYAYAAGNAEDSPIRGLYGVAPLPAGDSGQGASTLGGWQIGLSRFSRYPEQSARLIRFLTSREIQLSRAVERGHYPTRRSLYADGSLEASGNPIFASLLDVLETTVPRPAVQASPNYNEFSQIFFNGVHEILAGRAPADEALAEMEAALETLLARD